MFGETCGRTKWRGWGTATSHISSAEHHRRTNPERSYQQLVAHHPSTGAAELCTPKSPPPAYSVRGPADRPHAVDSASQSVCERRTDGRGAEESGLSARVDQRRAVATSATLHLRRAQKLPHGRAQLVRGHSNAIRTPPLRATSHRGASQRSWALCKSRPAPSGRRLRSTASLRRAQKLPRGRARSSLAGTTTQPAHPSAYDESERRRAPPAGLHWQKLGHVSFVPTSTSHPSHLTPSSQPGILVCPRCSKCVQRTYIQSKKKRYV